MRLINYGAGEIVDRLTILSLKIAHAPENNDHFRNEQVVLLMKLRACNGITSYLDELLELATVNGLLWHAEDEIRDWRKRFELHAVSEVEDPAARHMVSLIAFSIQELNDRRAGLVEAINLKTGEHRGSEKL